MRILIIRTSALGDVVQALPVLTALRRHLPRAKIGWVVEKSFAPLLSRHDDLDDLLVVEFRGWRHRPFSRHTWSGIRGLLSALERFSPDVVLDLMGNHKAGILAAVTGCDRRIGLQRRFRREPSSAMWISEGVEAQGEHAVDRALSVTVPLGLPREEPDFGAEKLLASLASPASPASLASLDRGENHRLPALRPPFVAIHPGAGWANKQYPPRHWGEVARRVGEETGYRVIAATGPGEEALGQEVVTESGGAAELVRAPTLPQLAALLNQAQLVMAGDTGPLHLAHALGKKVLCLMGPTDPAKHGPYKAPHLALWKQLPCSFCHRRFAATQACLLELSPATVAQRAIALMAHPGPPSSPPA